LTIERKCQELIYEANIHLKNRELEEAKTKLEAALLVSPENMMVKENLVSLYFELALSYKNKNQFELAKKYISKILNLDVKNSQVLKMKNDNFQHFYNAYYQKWLFSGRFRTAHYNR
jgi:tetratricopeptide (TPR) repeat protein